MNDAMHEPCVAKFMLELLTANRYKTRRWIGSFRCIRDTSLDAVRHASWLNAELRNTWQKRERIADARSL